MPAGDPRIGVVTSFDAHRGLGEVTDSEGLATAFHCLDIAGGARTIEVGAAVAFSVRLKLGRHEATNLCVVASGPG